MNTNPRVNGFEVLVLDGREITQAQYNALDDVSRAKVRWKVNGPHHNAKWAHGGHAPARRSHASRFRTASMMAPSKLYGIKGGVS